MRKNRIILMGAPYYGNLGDIAIFYAEEKFINDNLGKESFYYVPEKCAYNKLDKIKKVCNEDDVIILQGGGNMGNLYIWFEELRRKVIEKFPNNKIIIFPQTIDFSNDEVGQLELKRTKDIYEKHKNLTIIAREEKSYKIMKEIFEFNNVILLPDIVTYLNETNENIKREGVLLVLRDDKEASLNDKHRDNINKYCKNYFNNVRITDTHLGKNRDYVWDNEREYMLQNKFDEFRKSELVITDRLHGMIFAAITSTPCVAFDNKNNKIRNSSKWFEKLGYIKYIEDISELDSTVKDLKNQKNIKYDNDFIVELFNQLIDIIKNFD